MKEREFWDYLEEVLSPTHTEERPLLLGNVEFWRDNGVNCYFPATSQWNIALIAKDLTQALQEKQVT